MLSTRVQSFSTSLPRVVATTSYSFSSVQHLLSSSCIHSTSQHHVCRFFSAKPDKGYQPARPLAPVGGKVKK